MFDGFTLDRIATGEAVLTVRHGGSGPQCCCCTATRAPMQHGAASLLSSPATIPSSVRTCAATGSLLSRRRRPTMRRTPSAMARDVLAVMRALGHQRFAVVGHDRGAYVALRLALDHPTAVNHLAVLDAVPIGEALARCDAPFAQRWWHWFFLGQTDKPAERVINADPDAWYGGDRDRMGAEAWADYQRAIHDPATVHAMCEDYRAGLGIDRAHDDEDRRAGRCLACPTRRGWATQDDMEDLYGDVLGVWRPWAGDLRGHALDCGHHMAEEAPEELATALHAFLEDAASGCPRPD